jgi:glutamate carboxypeptidase
VAPNSNTGRSIIATVKGTGKGRILLLAHTDTVFKKGQVDKTHKFHIAGSKAYGLGIMDDKGSILLGVEALRILKELNFNNFETITFLINPDEETGSYGSRDLIQATARKHDVALVLEFGTPQDTVSLARKGIGSYS